MSETPSPAVERDVSGVPRRFVLHRDEDETGVSGTGVVAWGVEFPDGRVATRWAGTVTDVRQTCVWDSIDDVRAVHGHGGKTRIVWWDQWAERTVCPACDGTGLRPDPGSET